MREYSVWDVVVVVRVRVVVVVGGGWQRKEGRKLPMSGSLFPAAYRTSATLVNHSKESIPTLRSAPPPPAFPPNPRTRCLAIALRSLLSSVYNNVHIKLQVYMHYST